MTISLFAWQTWLVIAFVLGLVEAMTGTVLLGGMALGALITAVAVGFAGAQMAVSGLDWALPLAIWAIASLVGTWVVSKAFARAASQDRDVNDAPYKGDRD